MSRTLNGNLTGKAAQTEQVERRELQASTFGVSSERRAEIREEVAMGLERDRANYWAASVTLNWSAASLILHMMDEGTEASPIISGGEILELGTITNNIEIPY